MVLSKKKTAATMKKRNLVSYSHPDSIISEQFRMIQTNIKLLMPREKGRTFLITSPGSGEGKSVTAANLAVSMALQKEKVLLIDGNLRTPILQTIFKISNNTGLSDVLTGKAKFEEAVYCTEIGRLDLLTSGLPAANPGELLGSDRMIELFKEGLKRYDVILIDSFGLNNVTDTKLLAKIVDGVILVIQEGKTTHEKAAEAKKELEFSKANLIGTILSES